MIPGCLQGGGCLGLVKFFAQAQPTCCTGQRGGFGDAAEKAAAAEAAAAAAALTIGSVSSWLLISQTKLQHAKKEKENMKAKLVALVLGLEHLVEGIDSRHFTSFQKIRRRGHQRCSGSPGRHNTAS